MTSASVEVLAGVDLLPFFFLAPLACVELCLPVFALACVWMGLRAQLTRQRGRDGMRLCKCELETC